MSGNLLVVDWDYFFPNPMEAGIESMRAEAMLYDWGHRENSFFVNEIWHTRTHGFLMNDLRLPMVTPEWKSFPDRFTLAEDAVIYVADSNMYAGNIESPDGGPFEDVWLYDAHHDAGYGVKSFAQWLSKHVTDEGASYSCEDWMLIHYMQGTQLHWRWPTWHESLSKTPKKELVKAWPSGVELDAQRDNLAPLRETVDTVFICRSGAWVPPWCDTAFLQFTESWSRDIEQLDDVDLVRPFDLEEAKEQTRIIREMTGKARA